MRALLECLDALVGGVATLTTAALAPPYSSQLLVLSAAAHALDFGNGVLADAGVPRALCCREPGLASFGTVCGGGGERFDPIVVSEDMLLSNDAPDERAAAAQNAACVSFVACGKVEIPDPFLQSWSSSLALLDQHSGGLNQKRGYLNNTPGVLWRGKGFKVTVLGF